MPIWNQHNSTGFCAEAATVWRPGGDPSPRPPCKQVSLGTVSSMLLALRGAAGFHSYMPKEGDSSQLHHTMQVKILNKSRQPVFEHPQGESFT